MASRSPHILALLTLLGLAACSSCSSKNPDPELNPGGNGTVVVPEPQEDGKAAILGYSIVATYPHDRGSYTQGLTVHEGTLYESTGRRGESTLMTVDLETGKALRKHGLEDLYFGEGIAIWKGLLVQLTWQEQVAFVYDRSNFQEQYRLQYEGEGWGLTCDGEFLIMSNGSEFLRFLRPKDMKVERTLRVTLDGKDLWNLNELEYIEGEIWANVYQRELIVRIDPKSGRVRSVIDLRGLQSQQGVSDVAQDVLNGIAYDADKGRIFITGKHWPNLYEIRVDK